MARISLIMPVFNAEKTLDYSVDSVFKQTEDDFEFIAVNDGSIDDSLKKLEELKSKSKIEFKIIDKPNGGAASARKVGLEKSTGDIIGFIDSDDIIDKDYLKNMYDTLYSTNTNICCSRMAIHLDNPLLKNIPLKNKRRRLKYDALKDRKIVPIMNVVTNGKLFKREYIDITNKDFVANEDLSKNYYLYAKARNISFANDVTYHYMPNGDGLVSNNIFGYTWDRIKNTLLPLSELKNTFENGFIFEDYYYEVEQLFIKNIFDRVNYISSNVPDCEDKDLLINILYDYISYHFPNWQENPYLLTHFKDFEIPDTISTFQNSSRVSNYIPMPYESEDEIYNNYEAISKRIQKKSKTKSLW